MEQPHERPPERANVLLVDDQPANLLALRAILDDPGHNLVDAHFGEDALRRLAEDDFAVVLLDVQMHGLDGFETARRIRGAEKSRHTPIIFITAYDDDRPTVEKAYSLGAVDFLVKPLVPVILRAKVAGFVELYRKTEEVKRQAERLRLLERRGYERLLAEENARLRESEQFHRAIAELASDFGYSTRVQADGDVILESVTAGFTKVTGYTLEELNARGGWPTIILPDDMPVLAASIGRLLAGQEARAEARFLPKAGGVRWLYLLGHPVWDEGRRRVVCIYGAGQDITERKRVEEELKQTARQKDEFLAMLAHELRNPLAPIRNALHILKMPGANSEAARKARDMMDRQIQQLVRLVDDLLDVSRIVRNRIELRKETVDLATVFARAVETAQPLIEAQRHQLGVSLPPEPVRLEADPVRLAQVISNLLLNAAKYTDPAGRIWLSGERQGGEAILRVRDTGIGIDPQLLPRVFDLFTQADRSLARSQGGLGIGLTLVKHLVEMHGGSVRAGSPGPGAGSEFTIRLPLLWRDEGREMRDEKRKNASDSSLIPHSLKVLVVDDNTDAAQSAAMLLVMQGHRVETAHDGPSALEAARAFRPEVVLLDIGLPGMDGFEVARAMRAQLGNGTPVLVAVTGYGQEEDRRRSQEAGFDRHLVKPVEPAALAALLGSLRAPVAGP
jgi:PAS domain S-box-containing protein